MIKDKLVLLPESPGCYIMYNEKHEIIYVGKAKILKNRVRQYFSGVHDLKTQRLVNEIKDFEFIITDSEKDALLLEINLIKKHVPKYNIALKDGKSYPYIKISPNANPVLSIVRNPKRKQGIYYGPYPNVNDAKAIIQLLNKIYGLYESKYLVEKESKSYRLKQQKGKYTAQYEVNPEVIVALKRFFNGDTKTIVNEIKETMQRYSNALEFEKAQQQLELLNAIEHVVSKNKVQLNDTTDKDLFNYYAENGYISIQVFMIRNGKLIERFFKVFDLYNDAEEEFVSFIVKYYEENTLPKQIIIPNHIDMSLLLLVLNVKIIQPQKNEKLKMLENVYENAKKQLKDFFELQMKSSKDIENLKSLENILNVKLDRIEVFDNSHFAATHNVSGMIVVENGVFNKKAYRHFKLADYESDYHSMKEVIYRRYFRLMMEEKSFPSAVFVDGGLLQMNAALEALNELNIKIPVFGMVKDDKHRSASLMNQYHEIVDIPKKSNVFFYLTKIQDEVHRYVITYHRDIRSKSMTKSFLDDIKGVGEARKIKLLKHFKTIKNIQNATMEQLCEVVPRDVAENIKQKSE